MRHINKDPLNVIARTRLTTDRCIQDVTVSVNTTKGNYSSSRYGHEDVREQLEELYRGKCCYCESQIRPVSPEHVEHYRPKSEISGVNNSGYYWLGNEWENLMIVCPACNGRKLAKFPVNNHRVTTHPTDQDNNLDFDQIPIHSGYLNNERPLIINPEYHYPENLMYHDNICQLIPVKNNKLARITIEEVGLNNDTLILKKQKIIDEIISDIEFQLYERYRDDEQLSEVQFLRQLNRIFDLIVKRIHPNEEYTMLGRDMIARFDEIILEDFEEPFDEIIREHFTNFIQNY
jgi:uncharacterized protein (TIGR02646 family)